MKKLIGKKLGGTLLAVAMAATTIGAIAPPATAASGGCVTRAEFSRVHNGMTVGQVSNIYGTRGTVALSSPPIVIRNYSTCVAYHVTNVSYWSGRVTGKLYI